MSENSSPLFGFLVYLKKIKDETEKQLCSLKVGQNDNKSRIMEFPDKECDMAGVNYHSDRNENFCIANIPELFEHFFLIMIKRELLDIIYSSTREPSDSGFQAGLILRNPEIVDVPTGKAEP